MADHDALIEQLRLEAESCYPQMAGLLTEAADALAALSAPPTDPEARREEIAAAIHAEMKRLACPCTYQVAWGMAGDVARLAAPIGDETVERAAAELKRAREIGALARGAEGCDNCDFTGLVWIEESDCPATCGACAYCPDHFPAQSTSGTVERAPAQRFVDPAWPRLRCGHQWQGGGVYCDLRPGHGGSHCDPHQGCYWGERSNPWQGWEWDKAHAGLLTAPSDTP